MISNSSPIIYDEHQMQAIRAALADQDTLGGFVSFEESSDIVDRGNQRFAVFGGFAYELTCITDGEELDGLVMEIIPVIIDGKAFGRFPDEGHSGVLHVSRTLKRGGKVVGDPEWCAYYQRCGWIYERELGLSASVIAETIAGEVAAGKTVITGFSDRG